MFAALLQITSREESPTEQPGMTYLEGVAPGAVQGGGEGSDGEEEQGGGGYCSRKRIFYHQPDTSVENFSIMLMHDKITRWFKDLHEVQFAEETVL